ncbi:DHA2 family multidrug resistance protein-like MFS transporter [Herbihabitans rhizosphaerae]|uniref:DHA2 family multidrug resistance protein-like MFS transporter n=1 Tax=Herbihabitans rhizosphaerae TaxID=1872711 RepID=A0A4Q7KEK8_9PSEU|nr:MFS transporter [Herbihabitans rhizosphaerae]RZS32684.1 DHA2 family multidrug resistance protein-like MFS transporter [Herbihabitans rhizosphaerae]
MTESMSGTVNRAGGRQWLGLAVLVLPTVLVSMDMTVLNFALPHLSADLRPSATELLWIIDSYGFLLAGLLITMGTLGDRIGRRKLLMIGAVAFGAASVLAAYADSAEALIVARAALGIGGATLMPSTLSLIRNMFRDAAQRRTAIAIWTAGFSVGIALGPVLGGLLLESFWWGSVFLINVPVMILLVATGPFLLSEYRDPNPGRFDLLSALLSLAAVLPVVYGVKHVAQHGLGTLAVVTVAAGLAIGFLFVRRQRRLENPMIDVRLFAERAFTASMITSTLVIFSMVGVSLYIAQYLQLVLNIPPLEAGLWMLPAIALAAVGATMAAVLVQKIRPATVVCAGLLLTAAGFAVMTQAGPDSSLLLVLAGFAGMAAGMSSVQALSSDMIVAAAPPERAGAASALTETASELGGALGVAVLGSIGAAVYRTEIAETAPSGLSPETVAASRETLGAAVEAAGHLPTQVGDALTAAARVAFSDGMHVAAIVGVVLMLATTALAAALLRHIRPGDQAPPEENIEVYGGTADTEPPAFEDAGGGRRNTTHESLPSAIGSAPRVP